MKTAEEIVLDYFGDDVSGYIYATPEDLKSFHRKIWNEAIEAAAEAAWTTMYNIGEYEDHIKKELLKLKL